MGIYESNCNKCNKPFTWWSGDKSGLCPQCIDNMGGGYHEVERKYKNRNDNLLGCFYFIGLNEAETYEDAINLLIERGVPEDEIVRYDVGS